MSVTEKNDAVQRVEPQVLPDTAKSEEGKMPKKRRRREKKPRAPMKENPNSFAAGKNMYKLIWVFFIGCILGYCAEMIFAYAKNGTWVNRQGLLYGPFNQIYGMGAVLFTITLYRLRNANGVIVFVASAIAGSAFEWACSFAQEMLFGCVSWEYSDTPANLGGRTNLFFAICWGVMGFLFIRNLYPYLSERIERIPNKIGKTLTVIIAVFMGVNILLSAAAVTRQSARKQGNPPLTIIGECLDQWYPDEFLAKVYTSMEFVE